MLGYKAAKSDGKKLIVTLEIPNDAITNLERKSVVVKESAKYRCNKAKVLKIEDENGKEYKEAISLFSGFPSQILYKVNEVVEVDNFDMNLENVCSSGIHFFLNKSVAEQYMISCDTFTGILNHYLDNGTLSIQSSYVNGKKNGIEIRYLIDGCREEYSCVDGKFQGLAVLYDNKGEIINKTVYADNDGYILYNRDTMKDKINNFTSGFLFGELFTAILIGVTVGVMIKKAS